MFSFFPKSVAVALVLFTIYFLGIAFHLSQIAFSALG
jgi:hypothetical protein